MSNRKNWVDQLTGERYLVWAVVFTVLVGAALLAQISIAKVHLEAEDESSSILTLPHDTKKR